MKVLDYTGIIILGVAITPILIYLLYYLYNRRRIHNEIIKANSEIPSSYSKTNNEVVDRLNKKVMDAMQELSNSILRANDDFQDKILSNLSNGIDEMSKQTKEVLERTEANKEKLSKLVVGINQLIHFELERRTKELPGTQLQILFGGESVVETQNPKGAIIEPSTRTKTAKGTPFYFMGSTTKGHSALPEVSGKQHPLSIYGIEKYNDIIPDYLENIKYFETGRIPPDVGIEFNNELTLKYMRWLKSQMVISEKGETKGSTKKEE